MNNANSAISRCLTAAGAILVGCGLVMSLPLSASAGLYYNFTEIYVGPDWYRTTLSGINESGQISATGGTGSTHGYLLNLSGAVVEQFQYPAGVSTWTGGINAGGQVVGDDRPAYLRRTDGTFDEIAVPGAEMTSARGINDDGHVVGSFAHPEPSLSGAYLKIGDTFTTIQFPGAQTTAADGVNNFDQVVGHYWDSSFNAYGYLYDSGIFSQFDVDPDPYGHGPRTELKDINELGDIVGTYAADNIWSGGGFLYTGGSFFEVEFPGSTATKAYGIDNYGRIVGSFFDWDDEHLHGFLAVPTGQDDPDAVELNEIDGTVAVIPEPAGLIIWSLLGALAITVGWWQRRRAA